MLPDKTIEQLVKYYYGWKKTRTRTSLMDRQARKLQAQREDKGLSAGEEMNDNESDESETPAPASSSAAAGNSNSTTTTTGGPAAPTSASVASPKPKCFNCGILCHVTHSTPKGQMCGTCNQVMTTAKFHDLFGLLCLECCVRTKMQVPQISL